MLDPIADRKIFSATAAKTIVNTSAQTTALADGIGTKMVLANTLKPGTRVRLHGEGIYSIPAIVASSITIRVKLGSTVIGSITTSSLFTGATNKAFSFDCLISCRTDGATGKVVIGGTASYTTSGGTKIFDDLDNGGAEVTVDTTIDNAVDVTLQWDSATTSRTITVNQATIMTV